MLKENIILTCVYRSPNSTPDNSSDINKCLENLSRRFCWNLLVTGDFSYPKTDWKHYSTTSSPNDLNSKFLECTRHCFLNSLFQNLLVAGGSSQPTLIDLVLNNNPDITHFDVPLRKSDQMCY